jgi:hypothetical protein
VDPFLRVLFLFEVFRIISAGTEMGISNEKNSGHQQLHWDFKGPGSKA